MAECHKFKHPWANTTECLGLDGPLRADPLHANSIADDFEAIRVSDSKEHYECKTIIDAAQHRFLIKVRRVLRKTSIEAGGIP